MQTQTFTLEKYAVGEALALFSASGDDDLHAIVESAWRNRRGRSACTIELSGDALKRWCDTPRHHFNPDHYDPRANYGEW